MTMTELAHRVVDGWTIDKRVSLPVILALISGIITAVFFLSDLKNEVRANARESVVLRQEFSDTKEVTKAIPFISERVGRLEATVAASVSRQERQFEEIKSLIVQNRPKAQVIRRQPQQ